MRPTTLRTGPRWDLASLLQELLLPPLPTSSLPRQRLPTGSNARGLRPHTSVLRPRSETTQPQHTRVRRDIEMCLRFCLCRQLHAHSPTPSRFIIQISFCASHTHSKTYTFSDFRCIAILMFLYRVYSSWHLLSSPFSRKNSSLRSQCVSQQVDPLPRRRLRGQSHRTHEFSSNECVPVTRQMHAVYATPCTHKHPVRLKMKLTNVHVISGLPPP